MRKKNKLVYGVGINDANYQIYKTEIIEGKQKITWTCPFHIKWRKMIERCYHEKFKIKHPSYMECTAVIEWIYFSNFRAWMEKQDWEGKELDKDLLIPGNKIYGPDTCVFVSRKVNNFLIDAKSVRGEWPIGVDLHKSTGKFRASCNDVLIGKQEYLGLYETPEEAHEAWLNFKLKQAYILASQETDLRVAKALIERYENYGNLD